MVKNLTEAVQALFGVEAHKIKIIETDKCIKQKEKEEDMILKRLFKKKPDHYYSAGGDDSRSQDI